MGWGSNWDKPIDWNEKKKIEEAKAAHDALINSKGYQDTLKEGAKAIEEAALHGTGIMQDGKHVLLNEVFLGVDLAKEDDRTAVVLSSSAGTIILEGEEAKEFLNNKIPTHDPYTNPGAYLYYQCECGQVLDPKTKRFSELNNHASSAGWKIRWGSQHYVPYCPKCAREKGIE